MYSTKKSSGSALVYSLIVLFMLLTAALGVASVSVIERKNASSTGKSVQSFQVADSAIEMVLDKALKDPTATLSDVGGLFVDGSCSNTTGVVSGTILGNPVELIFRKEGSVKTDCAATTLAGIDEVKAVGQYSSTTRAISAAVAAGTTYTPILNNKDGDFSVATGPYTSKGKNQVLVIFSGTIYKKTVGTAGDIGIKLTSSAPGSAVTGGQASVYHRSSETAFFRTVSGTAIITGLTAGTTTTLKIEPIGGDETVAGTNSRFSMMVIE